MNSLIRRVVAVGAGAFCLVAVAGPAGCSAVRSTPGPDSKKDALCSAKIDDAHYTGSGDPNLRTEVVVSGSYFKSSGQPSVDDCETRLPDHPVEAQRAWKKCREVKSRSAIMYHVVAEHGAAYSRVQIRVRGQDDEWSEPKDIRK